MKLITKLVDLQIIDKKDTDLYEYSINILKGYIFFGFVILLFNLYTKEYKETFLFLLLFFSFRRYCGGLHLNNSLACIFFSIILTITIPFLCSNYSFSPIVIICLQIMLSVFLYFFPIVDNPKKSVTNNQKIIYKKYSRLLIISCFIVNILLIYFNRMEISMTILSTVCVTCISVAFGYIKYWDYLREKNN